MVRCPTGEEVKAAACTRPGAWGWERSGDVHVKKTRTSLRAQALSKDSVQVANRRDLSIDASRQTL